MLANASTRKARMEAHAEFDKIWKLYMQEHGVSKNKARRFAYTWLSNQMEQQIHIGELNRQMCMRVVAVCKVQLNEGPFISPLLKDHGAQL